MTTLINCTPHSITIKGSCPFGDLSGTACRETMENGFCSEECRDSTIPSSGTVPRVATIEEFATFINDIPCVTSRLGEVTGLPEPKADTILIVSRMVFDATDRLDVVCPDTGPTCVRNEKGHIVAVTRLIRK